MPRNANALICQAGASNERRVASCLVEAIDECRAANVDPRQDHAVFLILHQLAYLLTGKDLATTGHTFDRYTQAYNALQDEAAAQVQPMGVAA
jgi:hypothetical protein